MKTQDEATAGRLFTPDRDRQNENGRNENGQCAGPELIYRKSLLYRTRVERGAYAINHVHGCSHGCKYPCYAFLMAKRFGKVRSYEEWRTPRLVGNALGLLEKEVSRKRAEISYVHLCFSTDPFMKDHPEVIELSLRIMEYLNRHRIRVATLTKGEYPREITENPSCHMNEYGISLVSLNEPFRHAYEPFTAPYEERIRGLERLHDAGLRTWACIEPYPPPNMVVQDIRDVLERIGFVDEIIFGKLNYNRIVQEYKHFKDFYRTCRDDVLAFCAERGIRTYVKAETDSL